MGKDAKFFIFSQKGWSVKFQFGEERLCWTDLGRNHFLLTKAKDFTKERRPAHFSSLE